MKVEWVVAKYMEDLTRRETRNIGIILRVGDQVLSRFVAQREDAEIDGRRARQFGSVDNYKAWVAYWRYRMEQASQKGLLAALEFQQPSNFVIEYGGERLWSSEMPEPVELLDNLYQMLVSEPRSSQALSPRDKSDAIIDELPITDRIERDIELEHAGPGRIKFDYRYLDGADHVMRVVGLARSGKLGWQATESATWAFGRAKEILGEKANPIALVVTSNREADVIQQLDLLKTEATVVDLANAQQAKISLSKLFRLAG